MNDLDMHLLKQFYMNVTRRQTSGRRQLRTVRSSRPHQQWRNQRQENCSAVATAAAVVAVAVAAAAAEIAGCDNGSEENSAARIVAEGGSTES